MKSTELDAVLPADPAVARATLQRRSREHRKAPASAPDGARHSAPSRPSPEPRRDSGAPASGRGSGASSSAATMSTATSERTTTASPHPRLPRGTHIRARGESPVSPSNPLSGGAKAQRTNPPWPSTPSTLTRRAPRTRRAAPCEERDPVARGRVQLLPAGRDPVAQAQVVMDELLRLESLYPGWDWSRCAVIARNWRYLAPVRAFCEAHGIPAQMADERIPSFWRLRETRAFVAWLRAREPRVIEGGALREWADARPSDPWHDLLRQAIDEHALETGGVEVPVNHVVEWLADWSRDVRRRQHGLLLLTAHRAKGLEFDHVAVLDGGWDRRDPDEDPDAPRRLYYVAMTRARQTLALARFDGPHPLQGCADRPSIIGASPAGHAAGRVPGTSVSPCADQSSARGPGLRGATRIAQSNPPRHRRALTRRSVEGAYHRSGTLAVAGRNRHVWSVTSRRVFGRRTG